MGLLLVYALVILVGTVLLAGPLLAGPLIARGRRVYALLLFVPPLAALGAGVGILGGIFLSILLFGFDLNGKAPWWDRYLPTAGAAVGSLIGAAIALFICFRTGRAGAGDLRDWAADYDDGGHRPLSPADHLTDAGR